MENFGGTDFTTTLRYDNVYRQIEETKRDTGGNTVYTCTYGYDAVGNRTSMNSDGTSFTYTLDNNDKLTGISGGGLSATLSYDTAGNLTNVTGTMLGIWTLVYDDESRLKQATSPSGTDYYYWNLLGQRYRDNLSGTTHRYVYDGDRIVLETDDAGAIQASYTTAGGSYFAPFLHLQRGGTSVFPAFDAVGAVQHLVNTSGTITDTCTADAFGQLLSSSGSTVNPYQYGGEWGYITDPSGLLQLGARFYWPELGRFIQQDPIGDGMNWYAYAGGNPVTRIDPQGLWFWWVHRLWSRRAALNAGMCEEEVAAAGQGGIDADILYVGSAGSPPHFDDPGYTLEQYAADYKKMAIETWKKGNHVAAAYLLGMGAHAIQDSYSHPRGLLGPNKHLWDNVTHKQDYDNPSAHKEAAKKAQEATNEYFRSFVEEVSK